MQFRHELKFEINRSDLPVLRQRLGAVMKRDDHASDGSYEIRSLYFDNGDDKALREKLDGVQIREKYRIRMYNRDSSLIHLERKYKCGGLGYKGTSELTKEQVEEILRGNIRWMAYSADRVILDLYTKIRSQGLRPKVIVDYIREPFVYPFGNVRVTLDYDIRTGLSCTDFLNSDCVTVPVPGSPCILEVKWDSYLPTVIRDMIQMEGRNGGAYSKYAACRMYD